MGLGNLAHKTSQAGCLCRGALVLNHTESGYAGATHGSISATGILQKRKPTRWRLAGEVDHAGVRWQGWRVSSDTPTWLS